jgi:hypothetical protein
LLICNDEELPLGNALRLLTFSGVSLAMTTVAIVAAQ